MVGSEGIGNGLASDKDAGEAAVALMAILQTQYLRYLIIASWALGLVATVGWVPAMIWFICTLGAGAVRGAFEKRMAGKVGAGWGMIFPAVATITITATSATVPDVEAWFNDLAGITGFAGIAPPATVAGSPTEGYIVGLQLLVNDEAYLARFQNEAGE